MNPDEAAFYWHYFGPPPGAGSGEYEAEVAQNAFENLAFPTASVPAIMVMVPEDEAVAGFWYEEEPMFDPYSNSGFGGYGQPGLGGLGGLGGYGSWGSYGGWGHGL